MHSNTGSEYKPGLLVAKATVRGFDTLVDFDSVERCLVLDLDSKYDLILGMAWLERYEPWIDWRSETLGATRTAPRGALESHELTSDRNQKRYLARATG